MQKHSIQLKSGVRLSWRKSLAVHALGFVSKKRLVAGGPAKKQLGVVA